MGSEKFCLRWNDFESNISLAFRELKDNEDFFDVTIACEDEQINAHKVILGACSPFFRDILRRNPHQHPLLYLSGVKLADLQCVLSFMYHGEVSVAQEDLNTFLTVAEDLKVKGLTQGNSASVSKPVSSAALKNQPSTPPKPHRPNLKQPAKQTWAASSSHLTPEEDDDIQELVPVKPEPRDPPPSEQHQVASLPTHQTYSPSPQQASHAVTAADDLSYDYQEDGYDDQYYENDQGTVGANYDANKELFAQLDAQIENMMVRSDSKIWYCKNCEKCSTFKNDIRRHIEAVHLQNHPGITCDLCGDIVKTRNALTQHKNARHKAKADRSYNQF